jgi:hypothetical protein
MPWIQTSPVNERMKFVVEMQRGDLTMVDACRQFGISRTTGYKIQHRQQALGLEGLCDLPRVPCTHFCKAVAVSIRLLLARCSSGRFSSSHGQ